MKMLCYRSLNATKQKALLRGIISHASFLTLFPDSSLTSLRLGKTPGFWAHGRDKPPYSVYWLSMNPALTSHLPAAILPSWHLWAPGLSCVLSGRQTLSQAVLFITCSQMLAVSALLPEMCLSLLSAGGHLCVLFVVGVLWPWLSSQGSGEGQEVNSGGLIIPLILGFYGCVSNKHDSNLWTLFQCC